MDVIDVKSHNPDFSTSSKTTASDNSLMRILRQKHNLPSKIERGPVDFPSDGTRSLFSDFDLYLFGQGVHDQIYNHMGAQLVDQTQGRGVNFAVWAPNARQVSVIGDFNDWDPSRGQMSRLDASGVWEQRIEDAAAGHHYKFNLIDANGREIRKIDPYGFACELPPKDANVIVDLNQHTWCDEKWMRQREQRDWLSQPISIYEVHLGSWRQNPEYENGWLGYHELAEQLVAYCLEMGFTHVELLPVSEHPYTGSWGYQSIGYYAPTSRHGTPADFMHFIDVLHQNGIGVIIDWVPGHFPQDEHGLRRFDGTALYEHLDPRQAEHPDWGTLIFNYGRNEVRNFLIANALFWLDKYHVDGLRVDAVASMLYLDYSRDEGDWVPNKFGGRENLDAIEMLKQFNERTHADYPGILTIAEESTSWAGVSKPTSQGGLGFSLKWNMGWMNDTLRYMRHEPVHRKYHHDEVTFSMMYAFHENFVLPLSHDEVVHGKRSLMGQLPGDHWQKFANLRLLFSYMWTHPGKKLLFMGCEFAQWIEWNVNQQLDWQLLEYDTHSGVRRLVSDLNRLMIEQPALHELDFAAAGFEWIACDQRDLSLLSYRRSARNPEDFLVVACNFTPVVRHDYRLQMPRAGRYREIFNSDSNHYGGSNVGNLGQIETQPIGHDQHQATITVPPLAALIFQRQSS